MPAMRVLIAAVALLVLLTAVGGVFLATRLLGERAEAVDLPTWAERMCQATATYTQTMARADDRVDPTTLELQARKERAQRLTDVQIEAAAKMADELRAMKPPEPARPLHEALIEGKEEEIAATREQLAAVEKASNAQQIAVANANTRFRMQGAATNVQAAALSAGEDVRTAIENAPACNQQLPGMPQGPMAPPKGGT